MAAQSAKSANPWGRRHSLSVSMITNVVPPLAFPAWHQVGLFSAASGFSGAAAPRFLTASMRGLPFSRQSQQATGVDLMENRLLNGESPGDDLSVVASTRSRRSLVQPGSWRRASSFRAVRLDGRDGEVSMRIARLIITLVLGAAEAALAAPAPAASPARNNGCPESILFIGNSYTYFNNVPEMVAALMAQGACCHVQTRMIAPG